MSRHLTILALFIFGLASLLSAQNGASLYEQLPLPERQTNADGGIALAGRLSPMDLDTREQTVVNEILSGNVPGFARHLKPITFTQKINTRSYTVTLFAVCDYMAIGSDEDYMYIPMTPSTAQYLADRFDGLLPTRKIVDIIYNHADRRLSPQPIPPSPEMTTVPVFLQHTDSIQTQFRRQGWPHEAGSMIGGHKKDIVISNKIYSTDRDYDRVVIYGWHRAPGDPIQPLYNGHSARYADYSHGVRIILKNVIINGDTLRMDKILKDPVLSVLLSDEGTITKAFYPPNPVLTGMSPVPGMPGPTFILYPNYPNPFNPETVIRYNLSRSMDISLSVYDISGRRIARLIHARQSAGTHSIRFNATSIASGIYLYTLNGAGMQSSRTMLVMK